MRPRCRSNRRSRIAYVSCAGRMDLLDDTWIWSSVVSRSARCLQDWFLISLLLDFLSGQLGFLGINGLGMAWDYCVIVTVINCFFNCVWDFDGWRQMKCDVMSKKTMCLRCSRHRVPIYIPMGIVHDCQGPKAQWLIIRDSVLSRGPTAKVRHLLRSTASPQFTNCSYDWCFSFLYNPSLDWSFLSG